MAKELTFAEKKNLIDKMTASINNKYGRSVCGRLGATPELQEQFKIKFIPFPSPTLNEALGGGLPRKRITILSGNEAAGKTGTLLEIIAIQQKNPNFMALWMESEGSLDVEFMEMLGIDMDRITIVMHDKDRGAEQCIDELLALAETNLYDLIVINSLKALVPKAEIDNSLTKDTVALQARMNAKMMRKLGPITEMSNAAVVLVNHLTTSIGGMTMGDKFSQTC